MKTSLRNPPGATALLTDLYQLTMAYGYWKAGRADQEAVFHLLFRKQPFQGGFTLSCGLADVIQYLRGFRFGRSDVEYLESLMGNDGKRLFDSAFLKYLGDLKLHLDVDAIPEGTAVFPQEPLLRNPGSDLAGAVG
jgi:nicotinate phosphoribosyltransferase